MQAVTTPRSTTFAGSLSSVAIVLASALAAPLGCDGDDAGTGGSPEDDAGVPEPDAVADGGGEPEPDTSVGPEVDVVDASREAEAGDGVTSDGGAHAADADGTGVEGDGVDAEGPAGDADGATGDAEDASAGCSSDEACVAEVDDLGPCERAGCHAPTGSCVAVPVANGTACDDANPCVTDATCQGGACEGEPVVCEEATSPCRTSHCDPDAGGCVLEDLPEGTACDDGDPCTEDDRCVDGACLGTDVACQAPDPCTSASCDPSTGSCVTSTLADGTTCDDGNACTTGDTCTDGSCSGEAVSCPDADLPCRQNLCNPETGDCELVDAPDGLACDDGDACTEGDHCEDGQCISGEDTCGGDDDDSCEEHCGEQAPSGCWCDDTCAELGDCCDDACEVCGNDCPSECGNGTCEAGETADDCPSDCGGDASSCEGKCGGQAPGGCWCDESCAGYGDCCDDACEVCGKGCQVCGDGTCGGGEDVESCPEDCGTTHQPEPPSDPWTPQTSDHGLSPTYHTEYYNSSMAARTVDGTKVAFVAGQHGEYFPYHHPKSEWDNVLLQVGDETFTATKADLHALQMGIHPDQGRIHVYYDGTMEDASGQPRSIVIDFHLDATFHEERYFGFDLSFLPTDPKAGMSWRPSYMELASSPPSQIAVGGEPLTELEELSGELELGALDHVEGDDLAFRYDYLAVANAEEGWVYLDFSGHALYPNTVFGGLMESLVTPSIGATITLSDAGLTEGNPHGIPESYLFEGGELLTNDVVDLGLADLDRQLVEVEDADGDVAVGLREIFTAK